MLQYWFIQHQASRWNVFFNIGFGDALQVFKQYVETFIKMYTPF